MAKIQYFLNFQDLILKTFLFLVLEIKEAIEFSFGIDDEGACFHKKEIQEEKFKKHDFFKCIKLHFKQ